MLMPRSKLVLLLSLLLALTGCASPAPDPTSIAIPATPTPPPAATATASQVPTPTPLGCLTQPGSVQQGSLDSTRPPQQFLIYLPPCYDAQTDLRYPVLYLLHGQTYTDDQWVRMGAATVADQLIHSGQSAPFIMVFPDDRYWNLPPGPGFGDRLLHLVIPYIDSHYRTLPDAPHRALGGLSRGGGWAIHMVLTEYSMFGIVGLHSPVIFEDDSAMLSQLIAAVPLASWPKLWLDGGDHDGEVGNIQRFEDLLGAYEVPHEWRLYAGDHTEHYWQQHMQEYLQWYADQFGAGAPASATPTP
jgi:enterochelin esterase-like enzyme